MPQSLQNAFVRSVFSDNLSAFLAMVQKTNPTPHEVTMAMKPAREFVDHYGFGLVKAFFNLCLRNDTSLSEYRYDQIITLLDQYQIKAKFPIALGKEKKERYQRYEIAKALDFSLLTTLEEELYEDLIKYACGIDTDNTKIQVIREIVGKLFNVDLRWYVRAHITWESSAKFSSAMNYLFQTLDAENKALFLQTFQDNHSIHQWLAVGVLERYLDALSQPSLSEKDAKTVNAIVEILERKPGHGVIEHYKVQPNHRAIKLLNEHGWSAFALLEYANLSHYQDYYQNLETKLRVETIVAWVINHELNRHYINIAKFISDEVFTAICAEAERLDINPLLVAKVRQNDAEALSLFQLPDLVLKNITDRLSREELQRLRALISHEVSKLIKLVLLPEEYRENFEKLQNIASQMEREICVPKKYYTNARNLAVAIRCGLVLSLLLTFSASLVVAMKKYSDNSQELTWGVSETLVVTSCILLALISIVGILLGASKIDLLDLTIKKDIKWRLANHTEAMATQLNYQTEMLLFINSVLSTYQENTYLSEDIDTYLTKHAALRERFTNEKTFDYSDIRDHHWRLRSVDTFFKQTMTEETFMAISSNEALKSGLDHYLKHQEVTKLPPRPYRELLPRWTFFDAEQRQPLLSANTLHTDVEDPQFRG